VYNSRNQLIETIRGPPTNQASLGRYQYNYAGMRIRHLGSQRGDIEYLHDGKSVLDEFQNNSTSLVAHYNYADRLISLTTPANRQFYHYAALGTTANLSTDSGTVQKSYRTDPFGEITKEEGDSVNRNIFTGHEHDTETGLIYMKARFYDPDTGRFLQQDSYLGENNNPPSLYRYLYAYQNPTVYFDPDGRESVSTMIDNAAEGCGAVTCAFYALGQAAYQVGTLGFASVHDPVRDAYDKGQVSGGEYIAKGIGGGTAAVAVTVATGRAATPFLVGATTTRGVIAVGATAGVVEGAAVDVITQGVHISAGIQDEYDVSRTAKSAALGGVIGAGAAGGGKYLNDRVNAKQEPTVTVENPIGPADPTAKGRPAVGASPRAQVETNVNASQQARASSNFRQHAQAEQAVQQRVAETSRKIGDGPVEFMAPPNATAAQIAQVKAYCEGCNEALNAGALSSTGRVSTQGELRRRASRTAAQERAGAATQGQPYRGHAGHVPDTTWTGVPQPYKWLDLDPVVNQSLGGQARKYSIGYKPTEFIFKEQ
jgi:RHS repeat-associated protein